MSELAASVPDPTQDQDVRACSDSKTLEGDLPALRVNTSETELLSDIFGLDLKREGGQYKLTPHDPNASLTELLTSPILVPDASAATSAELQHSTQVSSSLLFVKKKKNTSNFRLTLTYNTVRSKLWLLSYLFKQRLYSVLMGCRSL